MHYTVTRNIVNCSNLNTFIVNQGSWEQWSWIWIRLTIVTLLMQRYIVKNMSKCCQPVETVISDGWAMTVDWDQQHTNPCKPNELAKSIIQWHVLLWSVNNFCALHVSDWLTDVTAWTLCVYQWTAQSWIMFLAKLHKSRFRFACQTCCNISSCWFVFRAF